MRYKICSICGKRYSASTKCCTRAKIWDKEKRQVYTSATWRNLRKKKLSETPYCVRCYKKYNYLQTDALQLHHIKSLNHYPKLKFEEENLIIVCRTCNLELGDSDTLDFDL